ncbi:response regulator transcription factor [Pseudomonas fluorescens]|uniref:response regulator transcription factor n=1 Tax=Pseudomonas fluorescens TaxID=294 RepID=UPI001A9E7334|nr:response regulator transcription factor [Pseudomonas fluorescens]QTD31463.1 response regulator transcription factor [Pseudomonas fluorescens]
MKVLLVDDHPVVLSAVGTLLAAEGFEIVGKATNGVMAIAMTLQLEPDLIVLDIDIPQLDGLGVLDRVSNLTKKPKVLILTGMKNAQMAARCLKSGASGYVSKEGDTGELLNASKAIREGYTWFMADALDSVRSQDFEKSDAALVNLLSPRELNVLRCIARGDSNTEIAETLHISTKTVSTYKTRLQQKLKIGKAVALAEFANRNGLV